MDYLTALVGITTENTEIIKDGSGAYVNVVALADNSFQLKRMIELYCEKHKFNIFEISEIEPLNNVSNNSELIELSKHISNEVPLIFGTFFPFEDEIE